MDQKSTKQTLTDFLKKVSDGMIREQSDKGIKASGESARSLEYNIKTSPSGIRGVLMGFDYWIDQEQGGKPVSQGGRPVTQADMLTWMGYKGIADGQPEKVRNRIAYLIARKLNERGWNPNGQRVEITKIVDRQREIFEAGIADDFGLIIESEILERFKLRN